MNLPNDMEEKVYERTESVRQHGRSYCFITCPFCNTEAKAFIWSLCGGGKRCPKCEALHNGYGSSIKKKGK